MAAVFAATLLIRRTLRITGYAGQIEKVEIASKLDHVKKVELPQEQHTPVHSIVRSVPLVTRVATRYPRSAIPQSYRAAKPDASKFRCRSSGVGYRCRASRSPDSGVGLPQSGIAGVGFERWALRQSILNRHQRLRTLDVTRRRQEINHF